MNHVKLLNAQSAGTLPLRRQSVKPRGFTLQRGGREVHEEMQHTEQHSGA